MSYSSTSSVPIEMLPGIGHRTAKVLRAWKIATVGQFKQLPETVLIELFGPSIRPVYYAVQGRNWNVRAADRSLMSQRRSANKNTAVLSFVQKLRLVTTLLSS